MSKGIYLIFIFHEMIIYLGSRGFVLVEVGEEEEIFDHLVGIFDYPGRDQA